MNILLLRRLAMLAFVVCTLTVLLSGCIVGGGYYDSTGGGYYDGEGIGATYYEPSVVEYGGWGPGYQVAPFRDGEHRLSGGDHRPTSGGGQAPARAFKSAPASRPMPSIPSKRSTQSKPSTPSKPRSGDSRSR